MAGRIFVLRLERPPRGPDLQTPEHDLDPVAFSIATFVIATRYFAKLTARNAGRYPLGNKTLTNRRRIPDRQAAGRRQVNFSPALLLRYNHRSDQPSQRTGSAPHVAPTVNISDKTQSFRHSRSSAYCFGRFIPQRQRLPTAIDGRLPVPAHRHGGMPRHDPRPYLSKMGARPSNNRLQTYSAPRSDTLWAVHRDSPDPLAAGYAHCLGRPRAVKALQI